MVSFSSLVCYFSSQNQNYHNYYWLDFAISFKRISCLNKVKVTAKKAGKKVSKTLKATVTVKNPTFTAKVGATKLKVGEKTKLTVKKTPSSATVKYSTADAAVASISNGVITANGVGKTVITAKFTYGKKTITKKFTITVTEAVTDGVSVNLTNEFSSDYKDVVVTKMNGTALNDYATLRVYYGENGKGVKNENIILNYTYGSDSKLTKPATRVTRTDDNGVAYIDVSRNKYYDGTNDAWMPYNVDKVSYTITTERDKKIVKEGTFSFAEIKTSPIVNVNGVDDYEIADGSGKVDYTKLGYKGLVVSENDATTADGPGNGWNESAGTATQSSVDGKIGIPQYWREYVNSQQVSTKGTTDHKVGFVGGLPYITLPSENASLNAAKTFQQDVNLTASTENTYASESQYITLKDVKPNELTYATMNFTSLSLSKYTRIEIATFENEANAKDNKEQIGSTTTVYGPSADKNFAYQIPLTAKDKDTLCIKVTLKSQGQVNTDTKLGYEIKNITGVYKDKTAAEAGSTSLLKGASIEWKADTTVAYSEEKTLSDADILAAKNADMLADDVFTSLKDKDVATNQYVKKVTYRVPVFPYTGNAVVTTYDKNGSVIAYFAWPTENKDVVRRDSHNNITYIGYSNENEIITADTNNDNRVKYVYRISKEEAYNAVGTVTQDGDVVTVNAENAGVTNLVGTITGVEGLDATNSTVYTSVQWNPIQNATAEATGAIAFAGQETTVTAQLVDNNGNAVANARQPIDFKYTKHGDTSTTSIENAGQTLNGFGGKNATVLSVQNSTDSKGQAKLLISAAEKDTVIEQITASTSKYNVVIKVDDKQVDKLDVYWIEAHTAFGVTASNEPAGMLDKLYDSVTTPTVVSNGSINYCEPTIGEHWNYAFTTADETLADAGVWPGYTVGVNNAKIGVAAESGSKGTVKTDTGVNGMASATSNEPGTTTLVSTIDGSAATADGVSFTVYKDNTKKDKVTDTKSVGTGTTAFSNNQKLVVNWDPTGVSGSFVSATGFNAISGPAATFTMYFKVQDKLGNANKTDKVKVNSSAADSIQSVHGARAVGAGEEVEADSNGVVAITLQYTGAQKELVTVTLNGVAYTQVVTWRDAKAVALDMTTASGASGAHAATSVDPWKTYADNTKIVLTFTQDILASSVIADEFEVSRANAAGRTDKCEIGSVTVSGKSIIITLKHPITDGVDREFTVTMNKTTTPVNGITYDVVTTNGDSVCGGDTKRYAVNSASSASAPAER